MTSLTAKLRRGRDVLQSIDRTDCAGLSRTEMNDALTTFKRLRKDVERISKWIDETAEGA